MANKIILSADSTCDLSPELKERYQVQYFPYHIILGGQQYMDGVDIQPEDLYLAYREKKQLPKTAAISSMEFYEYFKQWVEEGYEVIHINLGSALSAAHQNCRLAAQELGHVYVIDSCSLSTGMGLLVIEAGRRISHGMPAEQIYQEVSALATHSHASFILDTLEFMHAGGRCSAVTALGANLLRLKPCIEVNNLRGGAMNVGKKYRGNLEKVLPQYTRDKLADRAGLVLDRVFITHSGISEKYIDLVRNTIQEVADFREICVTRASCTISCHCGPNTLGVLFLTK